MDTPDLLRALQDVEKRAERVSNEDVVATYVNTDALADALKTSDNGVVFGRRGTGKTHALKFLAETERGRGNAVIYIDLEQDVGSTSGLYSDPAIPLAERATRLLVDVLSILHEQLLERAFEQKNDSAIDALDKMIDEFAEVLVISEYEEETNASTGTSAARGTSVDVGWSPAGPAARVSGNSSKAKEQSESRTARSRGGFRHRVHFGAVSRLVKVAINADSSKRVWILLDEWTGVPLDIQPMLAEMLRKLFFGISKVTVRIGAIPHRSEWRIAGERGDYIGVEMGAELFPILDLDEFVVFPAKSKEEQKQRSLQFFRSLLHRHIKRALEADSLPAPESAEQTIKLLFTQVTALEEVVRAAEGVPRDALNIVARAGLRAGGGRIAVTHVREAAAQVYTTTKATLLNGRPDARRLLDLIVKEVIGDRKARAFLLAQEDTDHPLIQSMLDDRILHLIKRGYSSKDRPGERYDVIEIDYGCYVNLLGTSAAPQALLGESLEETVAHEAVFGNVEVPDDDYRAIRRAIVDLESLLPSEAVS